MREPRQDFDARMYRAIFEAAPDAFLVVEESGRIAAANARAEELFGYAREELIGMTVEALIPAGTRHQHRLLRDGYTGAPRTRPMGRGLDLHARRKDGAEIAVDIMLSPFESEGGKLVIAAIRDATEQRRLNDRLQHLADHDPLTGAVNRARLAHELSRQIKETRRYGGGALLMVDLDDFKAVNDSFGHNAGDHVLRHVAEVLRSRTRASDVVARIGGDEFAVLLPRASIAEAEVVAEDIAAVLRARPAIVGGAPILCTACIGVAALAAGLDPDSALAAADDAMYRAKRHGRDRVSLAALPA